MRPTLTGGNVASGRRATAVSPYANAAGVIAPGQPALSFAVSPSGRVKGPNVFPSFADAAVAAKLAGAQSGLNDGVARWALVQLAEPIVEDIALFDGVLLRGPDMFDAVGDAYTTVPAVSGTVTIDETQILAFVGAYCVVNCPVMAANGATRAFDINLTLGNVPFYQIQLYNSPCYQDVGAGAVPALDLRGVNNGEIWLIGGGPAWNNGDGTGPAIQCQNGSGLTVRGIDTGLGGGFSKPFLINNNSGILRFYDCILRRPDATGTPMIQQLATGNGKRIELTNVYVGAPAGVAPCLDIVASGRIDLVNCTLDSVATAPNKVIDGAGTIRYTPITWAGTANTIAAAITRTALGPAASTDPAYAFTLV